MRTLLWTLCGLMLLAARELHAQERGGTAPDREIELSLSDEAVQLRYITPTSFAGRRDNELFYTVLLTEERDVVGSAGLLITTDLDIVPRLDIRIGPQVYAGLLSEENEDVFAAAFGVRARYELLHQAGIAIVGHAFYSPDVLTFGSADNLRDFAAQGEIKLADRLIGFAGYRWFELDLVMRDERTLQNEFFAGIRWQLR